MSLAWEIVGIELMLSLNMATDAFAIGSTDQLIPCTVGTFVRLNALNRLNPIEKLPRQISILANEYEYTMDEPLSTPGMTQTQSKGTSGSARC